MQPNPNQLRSSPNAKKEPKKRDDQIDSFKYELPINPAVLQATNKNNSFTESQFSQDDACPLPNDSPARGLALKLNNIADPNAPPDLERIEENEEGKLNMLI